jgi:hypothetical protein
MLKRVDFSSLFFRSHNCKPKKDASFDESEACISAHPKYNDKCYADWMLIDKIMSISSHTHFSSFGIPSMLIHRLIFAFAFYKPNNLIKKGRLAKNRLCSIWRDIQTTDLKGYQKKKVEKIRRTNLEDWVEEYVEWREGNKEMTITKGLRRLLPH